MRGRRGTTRALGRAVRAVPICCESLEPRRLLSGATFSPAIYPIGNSPSAFAAGDFNGDGRPDIVTTLTTGALSLQLANADGTFQPAQTVADGGFPAYSPVVADFNGDGKLDVAYLFNAGKGVGVLLGNGNGTFQPVQISDPADIYNSHLVVADINGDGRQDIVAINKYEGLSLLFGNGDGTFRVERIDNGAYANGILAAGDFNGQGPTDLAIAVGSKLNILLGNGNGTFAPATTYTLGGTITSLAVADFNGDGNPDLVATVSGTPGSVDVLLGNGNGTFLTPLAMNLSGSYSPQIAMVGDFYGDGHENLATVATGSQNGLFLFAGNGDGTFQSPQTVIPAGSTFALAADFNGDEKSDLAFLYGGSPGDVVTLLNTTSAPAPLAAPTPSTPGAAATDQSTTPAFNWSTVSGATNYRLIIATNPLDLPSDPSATIGGPSVVVDQTTSGTTLSPTLIAGQTYYWEVIGTASGQEGTWSAVNQFTVGAADLPAPSLTAPANGATAVAATPTFTWGAVSGAASYRIILATNPLDLPGNPTATSGGYSVVFDATASSAQYTPAAALANGTTYYWEVTANNGSQLGQWSLVGQFTAAIPVLPAPVPAAPAAGATAVITSPVLSWSSVTGATSYRVIIATVESDLPTGPSATSGGASVVVNGTTITSPATLPSGTTLTAGQTYFWEVIGTASGFVGTWSTISQFTIGPPSLPAPALTAPAPNATCVTGASTTVMFSWAAVPQATEYRLIVATSAADLPTDPTASTGGSSVVIDTTTTQSNFSGVLFTAPAYYWEVIGYATDQEGTWSSVNQFTVNFPTMIAPAPSFPAANATNVATTLTFAWSAVSNLGNTTSYRLMVATNPADLPTDPMATTGGASVVIDATSLTNSSTQTLAPFTTYYWEVIGTTVVQGGTWSSISQFTTGATNLLPTVLATPAAGATGVSRTPTFSWSAVAGATSYWLLVATTPTSLPTDPMATAPSGGVDINVTTPLTTYTPIDPINLNKTYYWEVLAYNSGQEGTWSTIGTFTTVAAINTPAGGFTPPQIQQAYGLNDISFNGTAGTGAGQTVAIVDAYNDPNIKADLRAFDKKYSIAAPPSFKVFDENGNPVVPKNTPAAPAGQLSWINEVDLDVEWLHALAPGARIVLVETNSASDQDLAAAIETARNYPNVSVVSMSLFFEDASAQTPPFTTPPGHVPITYIAATGDTGIYESSSLNSGGGGGTVGVNFPAADADVLAVGGTSLDVSDSAGDWASESLWNDSSTDGGGYGTNTTISQPSYQAGIAPAGGRDVPDVSFDGDPNTGVVVYNSYNNSSSPWIQLAGTSFSTPAWAAIVAIADQGRALAGEQSLDGANDLLPMLYSLPDSDFHKFSATQYNMGAGLGTPIADKLIPDLVSAPATLVDGLLSVTGAAGNDTITVSSGGGIITVNVNGNSSTFNDSQVSSLSINSLGGNDQITVNESGLAAPIDATLRAGAGNDTITAGDENTFIRVGAGNNVITAGNGNNVIRAGLGADNIKVGGGSDIVVALGTSSTIAGGTGNDTLVAANHASVSGGGGEDFIWGTNGHDTLIGNVGSLTGTDMIYTSGAKGDNVQPGSNDQLNPNGRKRPANNAAYLLNLESLTQVP